MEQKVTFCRTCEPLCGMFATAEGDRITKLRPDLDHPLSRDCACPMGIATQEVQNDPGRVTHPLARTSSGEFRRVSWEQAMSGIGTRLKTVLGERGPGEPVAVAIAPTEPAVAAAP